MKTLNAISLVAATLLACGCHSPHSAATSADYDRSAIVTVVLTHMVAEADKTGELVRFVDLRSPQIEQLRELCGPRFHICSMDESESSSGVLRLKGTATEGVHITVEVTTLRGQKAEAAGAYLHENGFAAFHYTLRYTRGAWRIAECNFYAAS